MMLMSLGSGCTTTLVTDAAEMVGNDVISKEAADYSTRLMGQPATAADTIFGAPTEVLTNESTGDHLRLYSVKKDLLKKLKWVVRCHGDQIAQVSMIDTDPDGSRDIAERLTLDKCYRGQTAEQIQAGKYLRVPVAIFRSDNDGSTVRVYDISTIVDFMGARYCAVRFDYRGIFRNVRILGWLHSN
jgi:hypothetical protein